MAAGARGQDGRGRAGSERADRERADTGWMALRLESRRRFHLVRAWLGSVPPAALATARSGALVDAALLLAQSLRRAA